MCGIAGFVEAGVSNGDSVVEEQLARQHHRGPDARGAYQRTFAAVAQNRLAIIDLERGDPPLTSEDGAIGAVLNGEIYNYHKLRGALERDGHNFATACDTEVIAHLAERHSAVSLAQQLDGMFAFAIWDTRNSRLILGRDRFGKKPLYFYAHDGLLVFASEIKGVLAHPLVPRSLAPSALPAYLTFGYVPTPRTFYEGIQSLPPGHVLTLEPDGEISIERYWCFPLPGVNPPLSLSLDEAADRLRALLAAAVAKRMIADVPIGAFLSGGIDSSAVVAVMASLTDERIATFTIGFEDPSFDEREYAAAIAHRYRTDHHEFVAKPDTVELIERLVWHHDQPFGDSSAVPTFVLSELTKGHAKVALCGDGGDELFAGYERFAAGLAVNAYGRIPPIVREAGMRVLSRLPPTAIGGRIGSAQRFAAAAGDGLPGAYLAWVGAIDERTRLRLCPDGDRWAEDEYAAAWQTSAGASTLDRLLHLNMTTYLLDDLLVKTDRMSMAHALEVRSPFLDTELAEFAAQLPTHLKLGRLTLKRVLKHALRDELPPEILNRRKRGFGVPLSRWFRGDLQSYVQQTLGSSRARVRALLNGKALDALLAEHAGGGRDVSGPLWALLTLEIFLKREQW